LPDGFAYRPDPVSAAEERRLVERIGRLPLVLNPGSTSRVEGGYITGGSRAPGNLAAGATVSR
jgi:hypothetical protein